MFQPRAATPSEHLSSCCCPPFSAGAAGAGAVLRAARAAARIHWPCRRPQGAGAVAPGAAGGWGRVRCARQNSCAGNLAGRGAVTAGVGLLRGAAFVNCCCVIIYLTHACTGGEAAAGEGAQQVDGGAAAAAARAGGQGEGGGAPWLGCLFFLWLNWVVGFLAASPLVKLARAGAQGGPASLPLPPCHCRAQTSHGVVSGPSLSLPQHAEQGLRQHC